MSIFVIPFLLGVAAVCGLFIGVVLAVNHSIKKTVERECKQ